jgi:hypothetical protein
MVIHIIWKCNDHVIALLQYKSSILKNTWENWFWTFYSISPPTMGGGQIPSTINFTLLLYISTQLRRTHHSPMVLGWYRRSLRLWEIASEKNYFRKLIFEFRSHFRIFFEISKTKKLSPITFYYGKNFRPLAQSLRKLQQKDDFTKKIFCLESLYVWASYSGIRWNFKISPPFLYVPKSKLLVCKVSRNSKKKF